MSKNPHEEQMRRMDGIVKAAHSRFRTGSSTSRDGEVVDWNNPLEELMAREEEALEDAAARSARVIFGDDIELPEAVMDRIRKEVFDEFRQYQEGFIEWLFAAGPHPLEVLRRLFAFTKMFRASLLWNMGFRQIGPLLNETHAAAQWRCRALFGEISVGWSKPASAVESMRKAQKGNCNRTGGKKSKKFSNKSN